MVLRVKNGEKKQGESNGPQFLALDLVATLG